VKKIEDIVKNQREVLELRNIIAERLEEKKTQQFNG